MKKNIKHTGNKSKSTAKGALKNGITDNRSINNAFKRFLSQFKPELSRFKPELSRFKPELSRFQPELSRFQPELSRLEPALSVFSAFSERSLSVINALLMLLNLKIKALKHKNRGNWGEFPKFTGKSPPLRLII